MTLQPRSSTIALSFKTAVHFPPHFISTVAVSSCLVPRRLSTANRRHWRTQKARARYMTDIVPRGEVKVNPTLIRIVRVDIRR